MPFPPQTTYSTSEDLQEVELCESREKLPFVDYYLKVPAPKISNFILCIFTLYTSLLS